MTQNISYDEIIYNFNDILSGLIHHTLIRNQSDKKDFKIQFLKSCLDNIIENASDAPFKWFLFNIYNNDDYRENIINQNEKFFINKIDTESDDLVSEYDDDTKQDILMKLFEFRNIWDEIDKNTKDYIKKAVYTLVRLCQYYLLNFL